MTEDKKQFVALVESNRGLISSLCRLYYLSEEDQRDAFQDIVLQLWKSRHSFHGLSKIETWIYRVSINTLLTKRRKEQRTPKAEQLSDVHNLLFTTAGTDDHVLLLRQVIGSLDDTNKAIAVLHLEGYRHREIAEMLSISATNVSTRFARLKTQIGDQIKEKKYATKKS